MNKIWALGAALSLSAASAQSDLIRSGSIGTPAPAASCAFTAKNQPPITCWVGQKIIFLPRTKGSQQYGYQSFEGGTGRFGNVAYEEAVGKIATITAVQPGDYGGYKAKVRVDSTGAEYTARVSGDSASEGYISDVAFVKEITDARASLKGKTIWLQSDNVATYNEATDKIGTIYIKKFQPVKVEDVSAGWYNFTPVQLVVRLPDGRQAFTHISFYGWNAGSLRDRFAFSREVFTTDPRLTYKWPVNIWKALEDNKIIPGMTKQQVYFSRSQGYTVSKSTTASGEVEQWTYKGFGIVTFINGKVSSFTELD